MEIPQEKVAPVILATWEAEIKRIKVRGQPRQIIYKTPSDPVSKITRAT
jgi:hypothetical protein